MSAQRQIENRRGGRASCLFTKLKSLFEKSGGINLGSIIKQIQKTRTNQMHRSSQLVVGKQKLLC